ncbi:MAG: hypothetical protein QG594_445 [Bacteroidota bacterium]|jgi:hypothetical protein|nr:hypothetical protein [Bacteroidota bacterium]
MKKTDEKININDIVVGGESNTSKNASVKILAHKNFTPLDEEIVDVERKDRKGKVFTIIIVFIVAVLGLLYLGHLFSSATVYIEKAVAPFSFSNTVITANQSETSELPFTVVEVTDTHHESIVPDMLNSSPKKATGSVIVYNSNSKSKISLKKGTTFIADNNIRFVSDTAVTLPGYTTDATKQIIPGQVIVKITAEKTGSASNIGNADLTLANYQKQKTKIYAKTNEIISGGADQMAYGLSDTLKKSVSDKIDEALKKSLFIKAGAEIPSEYILYLDMFVYSPKTLIISGTPQTLDVSKEASLIAYVIKKQDIEKLIKNRLQTEPPINPQYLGIENLVVKMVATPTDLINPQTLQLSFSGEGKIVSYVDTTGLSKNLANLNIQNAKKMLSNIKSLKSYEIKIKPSYTWLMPKSSQRIKIVDVNNN